MKGCLIPSELFYLHLLSLSSSSSSSSASSFSHTASRLLSIMSLDNCESQRWIGFGSPTDKLRSVLTQSGYKLFAFKFLESSRYWTQFVSVPVCCVNKLALSCQTNQTNVLLIVPSFLFSLWMKATCVVGEGGEWGMAAHHHRSFPHINANTQSTIRVVSPHSTDYKASAVSVCLRACRWLLLWADGWWDKPRGKITIRC